VFLSRIFCAVSHPTAFCRVGPVLVHLTHRHSPYGEARRIEAAAIVGAKIDRLPVAASHNGEKDNSDQLWYREQVAKHMTSEQIAEAQRLAREWKPEQ
jgi:hypothetical protein